MLSDNWEELANRFKQTLGLSHASIAITSSQEAPAGVPFYEGEALEPSLDGRAGYTISRIRTGMSPDEMTRTIPASRWAEVVEKLETRQQAIAAVTSYANTDDRQFNHGQPS